MKLPMLSRRVSQPYDRYPWGFGPAWFDYCRSETVLFPLGINVVMWALHQCYIACMSLPLLRSSPYAEIKRLEHEAARERDRLHFECDRRVSDATWRGRAEFTRLLGASSVITEIIAERERQQTVEQRSPAGDDSYRMQQLAAAAACYAAPPGALEKGSVVVAGTGSPPPALWPWSASWWKPGDRRRDLIKAGALIVAELERLDRLPRAPR